MCLLIMYCSVCNLFFSSDVVFWVCCVAGLLPRVLSLLDARDGCGHLSYAPPPTTQESQLSSDRVHDGRTMGYIRPGPICQDLQLISLLYMYVCSYSISDVCDTSGNSGHVQLKLLWLP